MYKASEFIIFLQLINQLLKIRPWLMRLIKKKTSINIFMFVFSETTGNKLFVNLNVLAWS